LAESPRPCSGGGGCGRTSSFFHPADIGAAKPASARLSASMMWLSVHFDRFMAELPFSEKILLLIARFGGGLPLILILLMPNISRNRFPKAA